MFQQNYGEESKNSRSEARFSFSKKLWLLMMFSWVSVAAFAQNKVTGTVKDAKDGSPLPGVTIQVKGQTKGTQTTGDGKYQINVADNTVLVFSFIGKATKEVTVGSQTVIDVSLEDDIKTLGEVVVIGYGSQKKKDLTGSVAAINSEDFNKGNIASPDQLVVGKVAGVQITSNGGAPGAGSTIRIRGGASLNANNDPLIVIDGVPLDNSGISGAPSALSLINPNDIESMNILKDASATAIYGSRASNGVICSFPCIGRLY